MPENLPPTISPDRGFAVKIAVIFFIIIILLVASFIAIAIFLYSKADVTFQQISNSATEYFNQLNEEPPAEELPAPPSDESTPPPLPQNAEPAKPYVQINNLSEFVLTGSSVDTPGWVLRSTDSADEPDKLDTSPYPPIEMMSQAFGPKNYLNNYETIGVNLLRFEDRQTAQNNFYYHKQHTIANFDEVNAEDRLGDDIYCLWSESTNANNNALMYHNGCVFIYNNVTVNLYYYSTAKGYAVPLHYLRKYYDLFSTVEQADE